MTRPERTLVIATNYRQYQVWLGDRDPNLFVHVVNPVQIRGLDYEMPVVMLNMIQGETTEQLYQLRNEVTNLFHNISWEVT